MSNTSSLASASSPSIENEPSKPTRHRVTRACDACRKNKVKCPLNDSGSCQNCIKASRPCTFENVGVRREKPPSKHDIQQLNSRIQTLEKLLTVLAPNLDLKSLPRTPEQARGIVNQSRIQSSRTNSIRETPPASRPNDLSDPDDVFSAIRLLNDLQIGPPDHLPPEPVPSSSSHSPHSLPSSPPQNQQDQDSKPSYTRAVTQMWVERFVPLHHLPNFQLPPQQLAITLISLFFEKVNPFENILHRAEFMRLYETDLIHTDRSFQALCFALFAAGSTFSSDPSVMLPAHDGTPNRQTAGATFLYASLSLVCPAHLPTCTLFDLQTMAVLCHVTSIICSPLTVWSWLGLHLRRVQNASAHRNSAPQWKTSLMKDQLRKRAVWYLAVQELSFSLILGRTSCIKSDTIDLDLPLPLADDALSRYCSDQQSNTSHLEPETRLLLSSSSSRPRAPADFPIIFHRKFGIALQKLFAVRMNPSSRIGERDKDAIVALAQEIENCFRESSLHQPWDPTISDTVALVSAAKRTCIHLTYRILLRRLLIFEEPDELQLCFQAANELINVLDHLRTRGAFEHTASWAPYTTVPATSMQLYIACNACDGISAANRANAWVGVHRCISVLTTLAPISSLAGQLQKRLEQVLQACVTNELFPTADEGIGHGQHKRDATEVLTNEEVAGGFSGQGGGKRASTRPLNQPPAAPPFAFPDGLPPSFPIANHPGSLDDGSVGQPCFRNPWSQFDASLFHHLVRPPKSPSDLPHIDPASWNPPAFTPATDPTPPLNSSPFEFPFDGFDLGHSFLA
ncbi:hypothetical protein PGT21_008771 [Puccinia graminis f. sp. tritici]|uniref:Zn(2)-C6 fungal-type domain-containing protein n=1 Tax=Puccinia graminis f. sp. tritici TaxID=56615 RepID=A0A5B0N9T2_PUCGR|nr:hypothetical protein PGT21_008771 [Puccinia graminis f. sp. tritici]KAA1122981.1 hypothetical protein PGTUg99_013839 [Puccinia graminis f. sp. tritici]